MAKYAYDPYGQVLSVTNATGTAISPTAAHVANYNPFRYRGYYYDTESGFYYLQSRYYDPEICRFINADKYAGTGLGFIGSNMFAYCNNSPSTMSDTTGNVPMRATMMTDTGGVSKVTSFDSKKSRELYSYIKKKKKFPDWNQTYVSVRRVEDYVQSDSAVGDAILDTLITTAVSAGTEAFTGWAIGGAPGAAAGGTIGTISGIVVSIAMAAQSRYDLSPGTYAQYEIIVSGYTSYPTYGGVEYCYYTYTAKYIDYQIGVNSSWEEISSSITYSYH